MRRVAITLTFVKGPKVDGWVEAMLQTLEQLDPATKDVEYVYTNFHTHFQNQFTDSTKQETTQATLDRLAFKFPFMDQYVSDFETLVRKVGYTVGSRESMNYFLKGLNSAPDVVEKVVERFSTDYQDLKDKAVMAVKAKQLIRAMRNSGQSPFQRPPQQSFTLRPSPQQYNSSTAPRTFNNIQVPMDLSRGHFPPNGTNQHFARGNTTQAEEPRQWNPCPQWVCRCYNCDKPRHFTAECCQPRKTQGR
jgi:hypothetical protein